MAKIREKDRTSIMNAIAGGVTPRQGIQHIQVGRLDETAAILEDIMHVKNGGGAVRIIQGSYGSGKALTDRTRVFTDRGLVEIGSLDSDDRVLGTDGGYHAVNGIYPQGQLEIWEIGFSNGVWVECSGEHLWNVQDLRQRMLFPDVYDTFTTEQLNQMPLEVTDPNSKSNAFKCANFKIPNFADENGNLSEDVFIRDISPTGGFSNMTCIEVDSPDHCFVIEGGVVTHNTFFLTLTKTVALKQNMMTMTADFSPDRRLYSSSGQANALYRELVRSLSSSMHPDGGALEELLNAVDEKFMAEDNAEFLAAVRKLPYGYDAITVCHQWHVAHNPVTDKEKRDAFILQDACLRWFAGENTSEHKKLLGVKSSIGDDGAYDALKMIAMLAHAAGYSGLIVELDECVNLYKINNSTSRDRNYEQILRIFNECLQGDAQYLGVVFGGTPEFVMDPRRGLFSYEALRSRLISGEYAARNQNADQSGPVIDLKPLSPEDLLVLLGNLVNVEALDNKDDWLMNNEQMEAFLEKQFNTLGADYFRTPREILRSFIELLRLLRSNPDMSPEEAIGKVEVKIEKKASGLGTVLDSATPAPLPVVEDEDEEDFGF